MGHLEVGTGCCHLGPGERGVLSKGWVGIVSWVLLRMDKITAADMDQCKKKRSGKEKPDSASSEMWARRRAGVEG